MLRKIVHFMGTSCFRTDMLRKNRQLLVILSIFIVFLWANGHQKGASLPLLGAECTSGMLNGDAPEYANNKGYI